MALRRGPRALGPAPAAASQAQQMAAAQQAQREHASEEQHHVTAMAAEERAHAAEAVALELRCALVISSLRGQ